MFIILAQALLELEEKCKAMSEEIAMVRKYVEQLEADNASMQDIIRKKNTAVSGKSNLEALFNAGFHVCPANFGQLRDEDCLFCSAFMKQEAIKENLPIIDDNL